MGKKRNNFLSRINKRFGKGLDKKAKKRLGLFLLSSKKKIKKEENELLNLNKDVRVKLRGIVKGSKGRIKKKGLLELSNIDRPIIISRELFEKEKRFLGKEKRFLSKSLKQRVRSKKLFDKDFLRKFDDKIGRGLDERVKKRLSLLFKGTKKRFVRKRKLKKSVPSWGVKLDKRISKKVIGFFKKKGRKAKGILRNVKAKKIARDSKVIKKGIRFKKIVNFVRGLKKKKRVKVFKKKYKKISYYAISLAILILIVSSLFVFGVIKKDCKRDLECFNEASLKCRSSEVLAVNNGDLYKYSIERKSFGDCLVNVKLVKKAEGTSFDLRYLFEGKSMECKIPRSVLREEGIESVFGVIGYCSGPLKEATYELLINKMYDLIVKNMGFILESLGNESLKGLEVNVTR